MKQNFKHLTSVVVHSIPGSVLDGQIGKVVGKAFDFTDQDFYIVDFGENPPGYNFPCIVITEACLKQI